ncbi:MAG: metal ABC transporter substrate-binding protein [Treponema sp.]|nr:metal ABC transporter substrate-binding protein [Treponema sp.]
MKKLICTGLMALLVLNGFLLTSCKKAKQENSGKISVVTTLFPHFDFARAVGGENIELTMLLKPGSESHSYEPTPKDMKKIQNADLFIYTGGENDIWADTMMESLGAKAPKTLRFLDLVDAVEEALVEGMTFEEEHHHHHGEVSHLEEEHDHDAEEEHDHEHEEIEYDEHVWTSPVNAIKLVEEVCQALCLIDSKNESIYRRNAASYISKLQELDGEFKSLVHDAKYKTIVFGDRFPFRYFADEYDLYYYAAFPGCASDVEVSASTVKFLIKKIKEENIPVVFTIEFSNGKIADTLCESTGARKLEFHSCHNVSADDMKNGETYISLMQRNLAALKEALL